MQFELSKYDVKADDLVFAANEADLEQIDPGVDTYNDQSAPAFLNGILLDAIREGASDIHFEPYEDKLRVRIRVDGVMRELTSMPRGFGNLINIRLKVVSGLDISEHRGTQGGRFRMMLNDSVGLDFRCSITPTLYGETIVLRMLYLSEELLHLDTLGMQQEQAQLAQKASKRLQGMVLVTGPTGSGKTVTLYTLLKQLNSQQRNIYTIEDPVEINLPGVNQINISEKQGVTFSNVARTILRQDPDVIMLGEMRDKETIDTAIKAAHTGHLVLSTLHATSAPKVVSRLRNMGVDSYSIASTVSLIISQRLLRKLDPASREEVQLPKERLLAIGFTEAELSGLKLYRAKASETNPTGYKGRVGIFQLLPVNKGLAQMIATGATDADIEAYALANGHADLRRAALEKLRAGLTDIDEVERVLGLIEPEETAIEIPELLKREAAQEKQEEALA